MAQAILSSDHDSITTEIEIAAPPERVFQALTDEKQLFQWFSDPSCPVRFWKMDARRGGGYGYATVKGTVAHNGVSEFECSGEILEYDPPRLLVYTWIANWHEDKSLRTVVRWELSPHASGTHVKIIHSGLAQEAAARKDYSRGWPGVVELLKKFVER